VRSGGHFPTLTAICWVGDREWPLNEAQRQHCRCNRVRGTGRAWRDGRRELIAIRFASNESLLGRGSKRTSLISFLAAASTIATIFSLRFFCLASSNTFFTLTISSRACESTVEVEPLEPDEEAEAAWAWQVALSASYSIPSAAASEVRDTPYLTTRQQQDWILECLQGGRTHPLAACGVATLCCSPPALLDPKPYSGHVSHVEMSPEEPEEAEEALREEREVDHDCRVFLVTFSSSSGYSFANCRATTQPSVSTPACHRVLSLHKSRCSALKSQCTAIRLIRIRRMPIRQTSLRRRFVHARPQFL
jgi:hypothetical protein